MTEDEDTGLPEIDLNLKITEITAKPRKLKVKWSSEAAQNLSDMWGATTPQKAPLQDLAEGLEAENFEEWHKEWKEKRRSPEDKLASAMADEMTAEIDREILETLAGATGHTRVQQPIAEALDAAKRGLITPTLHDDVLAALRGLEGKK